MYSVSLIWMFQQFPFTCEWLNEASNKLFEFVEKPFLITFSKKWNNDKWIIDSEWWIEKTLSWDDAFHNAPTQDLIDMEESENMKSSWEEKILKPVISKITEIKSLTIDQVLNEQEYYSSSMCEFLLDEINSNFWLENFKRSAILLIYLLLYWFIRISFWVMSGIAFIIFKILYRCRVYKISETTKKVDEIY